MPRPAGRPLPPEASAPQTTRIELVIDRSTDAKLRTRVLEKGTSRNAYLREIIEQHLNDGDAKRS